MKRLVILALIIQLISAVGYSEKPCSSTQDEYNYKCVNSSCFNVYIPRFKTIAYADLVGGVGRIPITFVGYVQFVGSDVQVEVQFTDIQSDRLTNRDNANSCLDTKFVRYGSTAYTGGSDYTGTITSTFDTTNLYTKFTFLIKASELDTLLVKDTTEPGFITYNGFYGLLFQVVGETQVAYYFNFSVKLKTDMTATTQTSFKGLVEKGAATCNPAGTCIQKADSSLVFCQAPGNCSTTTTSKTLYLNQRFSLLQKIMTAGFENFYLIPNSLTFSGDGLNRKANIISSTQSAGQTEIQTSVEVAYSKPITIQVSTSLSTVKGARFLARVLQTTDNVISGALAYAEISATMGDQPVSGNMLIAVVSFVLLLIF